VQDVDRVVDYLKHRFRNAPVSLVGHSWGGTLATAYLLDHGDKLTRAVVVCSILNNRRNDTEGYRLVLERARARQNAEAIRELEAVGPPPWNSLEQVLVQRRWAGRLSDAPNVRSDRARSLRAAGYQRPDTTWQSTQMAIVRQMVPALISLDLDPRLPGARTPLLLIACGKDLIVPPSAIRPSFDRYGGPKEWMLFENSGHDAYVQETERFAREVTRFLRAGS
jgi:proline iminopeptidase